MAGSRVCGMLGLVGVIRAGIDLEFLELGSPKTVLGEHAPDRTLDEAFRVFGSYFLGASLFDAARITGVAIVNLVFLLLAGEHDSSQRSRQ